MKANFDYCLNKVLEHEGGYVNDPRDAGGETNMGISKRSYPNEDIRNMTRKRAAEIYRRDYWNAVNGDALPPGIDLVAFDAAVNSGVSRGAKWVQSAVGAVADGKIGPNTISAANSANPTTAIHRACDMRLSFLRSAKNTKTGASLWPTYGKGWTRRVEDIRRTALDMVSSPGEVAPKPYETHSLDIPVGAILIAGAAIAAFAFFM